TGQVEADLLDLHAHQPGPEAQSEQRQQSDASDPRAQVKDAQGIGSGAAGYPGRQNVIGGKSVTAFELENLPFAGQVVEGRRGDSCRPPRPRERLECAADPGPCCW